MSHTQFEVRKDKLDLTRWVTVDASPLADQQVRVRIERFALTSNNITYGAFGDAMQYWQFFPSSDPAWGVIPVWGFAVVTQSLHPGVAVGERLYGYWPMANTCVLSPTRLGAGSFFDGAPHRAALHAVYNQYQRCAADPFYRADNEGAQALLRPLFTTSWVLDDFLADNGFFGADTLLLSSASSKTAYGTARQLSQRSGVQVIGLTSARNVEFCESLGCYHRVLRYEDLAQVDAATSAVYVDFAGNSGLRRAIHEHLSQLRYDCSIGGTHVSELRGASRDLPGPRPALFFAPAQIKKRRDDWGADGLGQRLVQAWNDFAAHTSNADAPWLVVQEHAGQDAVARMYAEVLAGQGDPRQGHMLSV